MCACMIEMGVLKAEAHFRPTLSKNFDKRWQESESEQSPKVPENKENTYTSYWPISHVF